MATSYIRGDGTGDYLLPSAWAADGARAPGDIGIMDVAETFVDEVVWPALADLTLRATANVRIEHYAPHVPLTVDTAATNALVEATAGHVLEIVQTAALKTSVLLGTGAGIAFRRCTIEGQALAVASVAGTVTGSYLFDRCTIRATALSGEALRFGWIPAGLTVTDSILVAGDTGVVLRSNEIGATFQRVKAYTGAFFWAPIGSTLTPRTSSFESVDIIVNGTSGPGVVVFGCDEAQIPAGEAVHLYNVNIIGTTAFVKANHYGMWVAGSAAAGHLIARNVNITGQNVGLRVENAAWQQNYCNLYDNNTNGMGAFYVVGAKDKNPGVDPLYTDAGAGDYRLQSASPLLGAGVDVGVLTDVDGLLYASPPPIGAHAAADDVAPYVDDATATSITAVVVDFSEAVYGADLETAAAWAITARDGGDVPILSSVVADGGHEFVTITVAGMRSAGQYTVEAPATLVDAALNPIGVRTADFYAPDVITLTVLTVVLESATSVLVTFSESAQGASLEVAAAWSCVAGDLLADAPAITAASQIAGNQVRLTISGTLTPGGLYTVTCPVDTECSLAGNIIATADRDGDFAYLTFAAPPGEEGLLEAITGAVGGEFARLQGSPTTRLTATLAPDATTAAVESTLHFPDAGEVWIEGERILYASRTGTQFMGLTRETVIDPADSVTKPIRFVTLQPGTPVRCATRGYSLKDQARNSLFVTTSTGLDLDAIARDRGYPRPIGLMSDASTQDYVCERYYQDAGTRRSVFATLAAMFQWGNITGTDGVAVDGQTLAITTTASLSKLQDRYCYVGDNLCRVVNATAGLGGKTNLNLEPAAGPFWQAPGITTGRTGLTYRLLPFRLKVQLLGRSGTLVKAANLWIHLYLPVTSIPATYLIANGTTDTPADGRPIGGQVLENGSIDRNATMPGPPPYAANRHPIYLVNPYAAVTRAIIEDIVPAGTVVRVVSGLP